MAENSAKPKLGIGEQNEGNAENKGDNARNGIGMRVYRISMGMRGIWVEIQKNVGNQGGNAGNQDGNLSIEIEITWNSNTNDKLKNWREVKIIDLVSCI